MMEMPEGWNKLNELDPGYRDRFLETYKIIREAADLMKEMAWSLENVSIVYYSTFSGVTLEDLKYGPYIKAPPYQALMEDHNRRALEAAKVLYKFKEWK